MTVKVKICGLTNLGDAQAALAGGADFLGFIFYPKSPRYVTPQVVAEIITHLKQEHKPFKSVGVFVNNSKEEIVQTLETCGLDLAQLHGEEESQMLGLNPKQPSALTGRAYKALRPRNRAEAHLQAPVYALPLPIPTARMPALLVDAYHPDQRGGTGQTGDWELAAGLAQLYPLLLAGGLTPTNVRQAIGQVNPWGVDVSSGIESAPGRKDQAALHAFIEAAKSI